MAYNTQYTVKDEKGNLYIKNGMWTDSDEWIIDQATGFYGIYMIAITEKIMLW